MSSTRIGTTPCACGGYATLYQVHGLGCRAGRCWSCGKTPEPTSLAVKFEDLPPHVHCPDDPYQEPS